MFVFGYVSLISLLNLSISTSLYLFKSAIYSVKLLRELNSPLAASAFASASASFLARSSAFTFSSASFLALPSNYENPSPDINDFEDIQWTHYIYNLQ
jgi:hypothetical protein